MLGNSVWISPHDYRRQVVQLAETLDLCGNIEMFTARHDGLSDPAAILAHRRLQKLHAANEGAAAPALAR